MIIEVENLIRTPAGILHSGSRLSASRVLLFPTLDELDELIDGLQKLRDESLSLGGWNSVFPPSLHIAYAGCCSISVGGQLLGTRNPKWTYNDIPKTQRESP